MSQSRVAQELRRVRVETMARNLDEEIMSEEKRRKQKRRMSKATKWALMAGSVVPVSAFTLWFFGTGWGVGILVSLTLAWWGYYTGKALEDQ